MTARRRFLIVDDNPTARKLLAAILSPIGACDLAYDGDEAVDAFVLAIEDRAPYDLICLDIMMPILDGRQVLQQIRRIEKQIGIKSADEVPVIIISALDDPEILPELNSPHLQRIVKPITRESLLAGMARLDLLAEIRP